jgi:hypothetical protein
VVDAGVLIMTARSRKRHTNLARNGDDVIDVCRRSNTNTGSSDSRETEPSGGRNPESIFRTTRSGSIISNCALISQSFFQQGRPAVGNHLGAAREVAEQLDSQTAAPWFGHQCIQSRLGCHFRQR